MSARWGTRSGDVSSRKHGIGGKPSPNSRHVQEAIRQLVLIKKGGGSMKKLPIWLYHRREDDYGGRTRRWGSAHPLRVCVTCMDEPDRPKADRMKTAWLGCLGRLHFSWGPSGGVASGHDGLPKGTRERIWWLRSGMAFGLALTPRSAA